MQHLKSRSVCHYLPAILILATLPFTGNLQAMGPDAEEDKPSFLEKTLERYEESIDVEWTVEKVSSRPNTFSFRIVKPERWQVAYLLVNEKKVLTLPPGTRTLTYDFSYLGDGEHLLQLLVLNQKKAGVAREEIEIEGAGKGLTRPANTQ